MMKLLVLLAVAVAGVPAAHGQDSLPAVKGRVTDASTGADIDFADVVIVDTSNRTVARTIQAPETAAEDPKRKKPFLF